MHAHLYPGLVTGCNPERARGTIAWWEKAGGRETDVAADRQCKTGMAKA